MDHAKEILDALFDSILHHLNPPIIISGTQGDAIISYFPADAFVQSQSIVEEMEHIYFDFQHQLSLMKLNTTCTCKACTNMAALDLKIFLHYGQYMFQQIGERVDLQGADVILIHRLMKNSVKETFGPQDIEITEETMHMFQPYTDNTAREFAQFVDEEISAGRIRPEEFREMDGRKREHQRPGVDQGRFAALRGKNI